MKAANRSLGVRYRMKAYRIEVEDQEGGEVSKKQ